MTRFTVTLELTVEAKNMDSLQTKLERLEASIPKDFHLQHSHTKGQT